jgi:hypothetical protein
MKMAAGNVGRKSINGGENINQRKCISAKYQSERRRLWRNIGYHLKSRISAKRRRWRNGGVKADSVAEKRRMQASKIISA